MVATSLTWVEIILLAGTGIAAGWFSVIAGGGSLLSMPMAIFVGLDAGVANGTIRIGVLVQNMAAVLRYQQKKAIVWRQVFPYLLPCCLGAVVGARFASHASDEASAQILGLAILVAVMLTVFKPKPDVAKRVTDRPVLRWFAFFAVGLYGGAIQAGVGYLFIAAFSFVAGKNLLEANILKVVLILAYTPCVLLFFWQAERVHVVAGLALASGQALGAWFAASFALAKGEKWLRVILTLAVLGSAGKLLGFY